MLALAATHNLYIAMDIGCDRLICIMNRNANMIYAYVYSYLNV